VALLERRIGLLFAAFLVLLLIAAARALFLGTIKGSSLASAATSQQVSSIELPARRGTIVDRHGIELAVSNPADDVSATPYLIKDPVKVAAKLAPLLQVDEDTLVKKLARRDTGFVYLARAIPAAQAAPVSKLEIPGIQLTPTHKREYPRGYLASQLLGSVGLDGNGLSGIEYAHEKQLEGQDGERRLVKDALGQSIQIRDVKPSKPGERLELSLDALIQDKVERVLSDVGAQYRPKGATAIVMNPNDGEILALANWPRVNANSPWTAPPYASQDRAVGATYEPGSTFKSVTVAGALQDGTVQPDTPFDLPPQIQVADRTIGEAETRGPETLTTAQILAQSSNVGAIKIGLRVGAPTFDSWVRRFGFGKPTGVDLPGEERGIVPALKNYSGSSMGNLPIGQGLAVTPIQMAQAYAAIANGGILRTPHVVRRVDGKLVPEAKGRRVISAHTAADLRHMLEGVFAPGGTASEVSIPGYKLAGKTGTANKIDPTTHEYSKTAYVASFIGFAPALHPRLLIAVMVDEPQTDIYGGSVAAPAFGRIASFALPYLRIPPG
jgi:cell division protein FtsI (penicillin-binding protein 3)/stage V sporulation protein D (sporulation-specific penicillin-binding protein)